MQDPFEWLRETLGGPTGGDVGDEQLVTDLGEPPMGPGYTTIDEGDEGIEP